VTKQLPTPRKFQDELQELKRLILRAPELLKGYELAYGLAYDERRGGDGVAPLGSTSLRPDGSATGYVPETAVESARADAYRGLCREMKNHIAAATISLGAALSVIDRKKNESLMGENFMQPTRTDRSAIITQDELDEAVAKKRRDEEMTG
jgi:hypothetical protein